MADWQSRQVCRSDWQIGRSERLAGSRDRLMSATGQIGRSERLAGRSDGQIGRLEDFTGWQ
eukprot:12922115-Prorocentrum_lima.AAC.1